MIKFNKNKRKMEYGMSFEPDWHQGSTATIVQGQKIDDKVAHNLAKVSQVASSAAAIYDSVAKAPKLDKTTAKKEAETVAPESKGTAAPTAPVTDPYAVDAKPNVDNTTVEPGSELKKGFLTKAKESFNEFTDVKLPQKYENFQERISNMFPKKIEEPVNTGGTMETNPLMSKSRKVGNRKTYGKMIKGR
jgi:hypothetical protein